MPYERFDAWRAAHALVLAVYATTRTWPRDELYGLISQARRASASVALNIAEGSAKRGSREFRRFLDIGLGSLSEVGYTLHLARDLGYLSHAQWEELDQSRDSTGKLLWRLCESLARKKD